jgi:hypothetical protein
MRGPACYFPTSFSPAFERRRAAIAATHAVAAPALFDIGVQLDRFSRRDFKSRLVELTLK